VWTRYLKEGQIKLGDRVVVAEQAEVLEAISREGAAGFYRGKVAKAMVDAVKADGGVLTLDDLAGYAVRTSDPLTFGYRGRTVLAMPPPSSGGLAMAQTLGILSRTGASEHAREGFSATYLTLLVEAMKHAFADRSRWLGDPAYVDVPVARLLSPEYLGVRAKYTRIGHVLPPASYGSEPEGEAVPGVPDDGGTSHLCVADAEGEAVACTETINLEFGSLVAVSGFCLNNEMDDFTTRRGEANAFGLKQSDRNAPAPGKRPLSSMSPTIVLGEQGEVEMVAGASGGPRIISATTQVVLGVIEFGWGAGQAVAWPRVHHQWSPNVLEFEPAFEEVRWQGMRVVDWMRKQRHEVTLSRSGAAVQAIVRKGDGMLEAASDARKGGKPAGR
jgi:gamma-glutamyltranspeptidase/glutathione hydrolase